MGSKNVSTQGYIQLVTSVMDGGEKGGNAKSNKPLALIILLLGILGFGFASRGLMPAPAPQTTSYVVYTAVEEESEFAKMLKPFLRGSVCAAIAVVCMILVMTIYVKFDKGSGDVPSSIVSVSLYLFPAILAAIITYLLELLLVRLPNSLFSGSDLSLLSTINALLSAIVSGIGGISALIFLYNASKSVLGLQGRSRYFATIVSILAFGGGLGLSMSFVLKIV